MFTARHPRRERRIAAHPDTVGIDVDPDLLVLSRMLLLAACSSPSPDTLALGAGFAEWKECASTGGDSCSTQGTVRLREGDAPNEWVALLDNGPRLTLRSAAENDLTVFEGQETTVSVLIVQGYGTLVRLQSGVHEWATDLGDGLGFDHGVVPLGEVSFGDALGTTELDGVTASWHALDFQGDAGVVSAAPGVPTKLVRDGETWRLVVLASYLTDTAADDACVGPLSLKAYELFRVEDGWEPDGARVERPADEPFAALRCEDHEADTGG